MAELIGYAGSALIVLSLLMTSLWRLRVVNLVGATVFLVYGILIESVPVIVTDGVIVVIDVYFLWKAATDREYFSLLQVDPRSRYVAEFLRFHSDEIAQSMPRFEYQPTKGDIVMLINRDMVPAGLFLGRPGDDEGRLDVLLDYAIPAYRDLKMGRWLYRERCPVFVDAEVARLVSPSGSERHTRYLEKMGFRRISGGLHELSLR